VQYKCTDLYDPEAEAGILWNDPDLAISWPVEEAVLSNRDRGNPRLSDVMSRLPLYQP
jgi:dTDP-4-dehydrorhamnose 3,5-epimerase